MGTKGIVVAGSVLVDKLYEVAKYPEAGQLTQILGIGQAVGGLVPNVGIDMKRLSPETKISAVGKIGNDEEGRYVLSVLEANGVETSGIKVSTEQKTSFTDVISVRGGQRTFFTFPGASADFGTNDIDFKNIDCDIFHLGYFLLLDKIDNGEGLEILKKLKNLGIETAIDLVSENSDRYELVKPCLPFVDYLIINELEAGKLTGIEPKVANLRSITEKLMEMGVQKKVIIHLPEGSVCLSREGFSKLGSYELPDGYIKGTTGAGDAFCAGALIGIYKGNSDMEIMELASSAAVMSLAATDATSGLKTAEEALINCKGFRRKDF